MFTYFVIAMAFASIFSGAEANALQKRSNKKNEKGYSGVGYAVAAASHGGLNSQAQAELSRATKDPGYLAYQTRTLLAAHDKAKGKTPSSSSTPNWSNQGRKSGSYHG